jgi:hypothetical protein
MATDKTADAIKLNLRLPKALHKQLKQQARRNNVSLNTEIINQLQGYEVATVERTTEIVAAAVRAVFREREEAAKERREDRAQLGAPVQRWHVIPLDHPIPETPEPKVPLPETSPAEKKTETESETVKSEGAEQK